ncbi:uncharacterized protein LOC128549985 [Mercenaria mercenaria]|uniref:uncharacterized protein LOC128549985 n=1 Tax=Mercenaria mercenaria TaxID=6596 RepID=UPI00234ED66A|nr:uncharacterized protein LOC128549985 [Mercenaria mercenaria]
MGRSCRERRKLTGVSEEKEQKKIRDKILKVFQARLSSPGQGGALFVAEPRKTDKQRHTKKSRSKHCVVLENTSTDDSSCGSMSGRGRKRTKSESLSRRKSRKSTKNKKEVEKDTAVSKHLRVAHGITGQQQAGMKNDVRSKPKMYSHSRITVSMKVRLFGICVPVYMVITHLHSAYIQAFLTYQVLFS